MNHLLTIWKKDKKNGQNIVVSMIARVVCCMVFLCSFVSFPLLIQYTFQMKHILNTESEQVKPTWIYFVHEEFELNVSFDIQFNVCWWWCSCCCCCCRRCFEHSVYSFFYLHFITFRFYTHTAVHIISYTWKNRCVRCHLCLTHYLDEIDLCCIVAVTPFVCSFSIRSLFALSGLYLGSARWMNKRIHLYKNEYTIHIFFNILCISFRSYGNAISCGVYEKIYHCFMFAQPFVFVVGGYCYYFCVCTLTHRLCVFLFYLDISLLGNLNFHFLSLNFNSTTNS